MSFCQVCREITEGLLITMQLRIISRTNLAKSPDLIIPIIIYLASYGKHVLSQFVKGITEYSLTNFRSGTLN